MPQDYQDDNDGEPDLSVPAEHCNCRCFLEVLHRRTINYAGTETDLPDVWQEFIATLDLGWPEEST